MRNKKRALQLVEGFADDEDFAIDETTEFVRENYIKSFKLPISLWEEL
jgi:hypothetical protein